MNINIQFFIIYINTSFFLKILIDILSTIISIIGLLVAIAFYTLAERKVMGGVQRRQGPHTVGSLELGISGFLQPVGDGLKLIIKEMIIPSRANIQLFLMAPMLLLTLSLTIWVVIPINQLNIIFYSELSLLVLFAISSLSVYGVIIAGWASNSSYAFLGALRSTAQMISYEISIGFVLIGVAIWSQSLNLVEIVFLQQHVFFIWPLWPLALIMFVSALAETNRVPFDLVEAEAEIVAGYNVEYSCILFAMFFLAEYSFMLSMSAIMTILFFGGWIAPFYIFAFLPGTFWFALKTAIIALSFIIIRATLPRVRYDQLMNLGWKKFLPLSLGYVIFLGSLVYVLDLHVYTNNSLTFPIYSDLCFFDPCPTHSPFSLYTDTGYPYWRPVTTLDWVDLDKKYKSYVSGISPKIGELTNFYYDYGPFLYSSRSNILNQDSFFEFFFSSKDIFYVNSFVFDPRGLFLCFRAFQWADAHFFDFMYWKLKDPHTYNTNFNDLFDPWIDDES